VKLDTLNDPQRDAVLTTEGPVLVLAGAGSGKTRVITHRVAYLLDRGVRPDAILAVSFTNKAAEEMKERVLHLAPRLGRGVQLSTFHALGLEILKHERKALGRPGGFTIYDAGDQLALVRDLVRRIVDDGDRKYDAKAIQFRISRAKNAFLDPAAYLESVGAGDDEYDLMAADIYPKYEEALRGYSAFDFDDLITETVRLLQTNNDVRDRWQRQFRYVMVDEYQDTNRAQFLLLQALIEPHKNVCVVGDDDQSIYGWRGAEATHILEFDRQFPGAKIVRLEENYRSTPVILDAANAVIAHNPKRHDKKLWTRNRPGEKLKLVVADDAESEARFVAEEIDLLAATRGYAHSDFAVLYRSNIQARTIEEAMRTQRIPYRVVGGTSFFDRREIKDAVAYLKLAMNPRDEISLRRVINYPPRGIGPTTLERLSAHAQKHEASLWDACASCRENSLFAGAMPASKLPPPDELDERSRRAVNGFVDVIDKGAAAMASTAGIKAGAAELFASAGIADEIRGQGGSALVLERRLANLDWLVEAIGRFAEKESRDLSVFLHRLTLDSREDDDEENVEQATLVTLHGAKGLEFKVVFLVGLEEELLPHRRTLYPQGPDVQDATVDLGEERRLLYVGITRAREILYISRALTRNNRGAGRPRAASRFLDEIPLALCEERAAHAPPQISAEEEDAFARASLDKLFKMVD
jgi:DNA helicase-2/ATP-dependent DNA helicase PcrA